MQEMLKKALQLADQAEVYETQTTQQGVTFQANKLKDVTQAEERLRTLRLIKRGKLGSAQSSKPGSDEALLQYAVNSVEFGSPVEYTWRGEAKVPPLSIFDPSVESVTPREMLDIAQDLVSALNAADSGVMAMAGVSKAVSITTLENSAGFSGRDSQTQWHIYFGGEIVSDEGFLFVYNQLGGTNLNTDTAKLKRDVIESFRLARNNVSLRPGQYPVIFSPREVSCLTNPLLACLNGKAVAQGVSPLKSKLGEQSFDPRISLRDDAHIQNAVGSRGFDREGIVTKPHSLIEQGRVNSFLLDLKSAAQLNMEPTGNGGLNGPEATNIVLAPGDTAFLDMLKDIDEGVLIDMTMGAWAGNPYGGQVSGNISLGYKIEKGQLVGRIKDSMFSVNVFEALSRQIHSLSQEQVWQGNMCFPYVRLNDVNISTKG